MQTNLQLFLMAKFFFGCKSICIFSCNLWVLLERAVFQTALLSQRKKLKTYYAFLIPTDNNSALADTAKNLRGGALITNTKFASAGGRRYRNFCIFIKPFVLVDAGIFINPPNANLENVTGKWRDEFSSRTIRLTKNISFDNFSYF